MKHNCKLKTREGKWGRGVHKTNMLKPDKTCKMRGVGNVSSQAEQHWKHTFAEIASLSKTGTI